MVLSIDFERDTLTDVLSEDRADQHTENDTDIIDKENAASSTEEVFPKQSQNFDSRELGKWLLQ